MYLIISDKNEPGTLETLPTTEGLTILNEKEFLESNIVFKEQDMYAITTEGVIDSINKRSECVKKIKATELMKDKILFRKAISELFTDYNFLSVSLADLASLKITNKMVVKPSKGFFGIGIYAIDEHTDLEEITQKIIAVTGQQAKSLDNAETILSSEELLVEDYINGREFAIDMFYDSNGKPQILNIYEHPCPDNVAYVHALYCSSKKIHEEISGRSLEIFEKLNEILDVKNFVMHAEFKLDGDRFIPIEINPLRIGGMGLGNMSYHAMGVNPYEYLIKGTSPDWDAIWNLPEHKESVYNFLIAYNGSDVDITTQKPDIDKLKQDLGEVLCETIFDYKNNPVFGVFISKETAQSMEAMIHIEFNKYFS